MSELIQAMAKTLHASKAMGSDCYVDDGLVSWRKDDLSATVDGEVDFALLAKDAIAAVFDWLATPSDTALLAADTSVWFGQDADDADTLREFIWGRILERLRKEAIG